MGYSATVESSERTKCKRDANRYTEIAIVRICTYTNARSKKGKNGNVTKKKWRRNSVNNESEMIK